MRCITRVALVAVLAVNGSATAQDHQHPASQERLGTVSFQTSCRPEVAADFNRGVALLHSFEFRAAMQAFESVLALLKKNGIC